MIDWLPAGAAQAVSSGMAGAGLQAATGCCAEATVGSKPPGSHPPAQAADPRSWCPLIQQVGAELSSHLCPPHWDLQRLVHTLMSLEVCSLLSLEATYTNDEVSQATLRSTLAQ